MADRVLYDSGGANEETEADRRRRAAHTRDGEFVEDEFGDVTEPNPRSDEEYRDAAGRDYGYGGRAGYGSGGYGSGGDAYDRYGDASDELSDFDSWAAGIPLLGDLSGANARSAAAAAEMERRRREAALGELAEFMPNADDLAVTYEHEDFVGPGSDSERMARAMREWTDGGLTDVDRAMMEESRRGVARDARAGRDADISALEARGMGGSGNELAAMLASTEGAADRNASMEGGILAAAQQRQFNAARALGEYGAREDDYSRGLEGRNTDRTNMTGESRSRARQQAHENRERHAGLGLGMSPFGNQAARDERDEEEDEALGFFGEAIDTLASI